MKNFLTSVQSIWRWKKRIKLTYHSAKQREKEGRDHKPFTAWNDIVKGIQCMLD